MAGWSVQQCPEHCIFCTVDTTAVRLVCGEPPIQVSVEIGQPSLTNQIKKSGPASRWALHFIATFPPVARLSPTHSSRVNMSRGGAPRAIYGPFRSIWWLDPAYPCMGRGTLYAEPIVVFTPPLLCPHLYRVVFLMASTSDLLLLLNPGPIR